MTLSKKEDNPDIKSLIFQKIDSYDVFHMYIPTFKIKQIMNSPIRQDKNPSFGVFPVDDKLLFKDFSTGDSGDCIRLVERMFGLDYPKALKKIAEDFGILSGMDKHKQIQSSYCKPVMEPKRFCRIQLRTKAFTAKDKAYWAQYGITVDELRENQVYSIKEDECFINRKRWPLEKGELAFGYFYEQIQGWKLLFPEKNKLNKWRNNIPLGTVMYMENLDKNHNTLIVKSLKDYMVCKKVYPHICYCQNESPEAIPENKAKVITENSNKVFYGGDCDKPGKAASYKITQRNSWLHVNPPDTLLSEGKDFADMARVYGIQSVEDHLRAKKVII